MSQKTSKSLFFTTGLGPTIVFGGGIVLIMPNCQGRRKGGRGGKLPLAPNWRGAPEIVTHIFLIYFFLRLGIVGGAGAPQSAGCPGKREAPKSVGFQIARSPGKQRAPESAGLRKA